jgi:L-alanine-DL-glutamate epimerase-like enolase superfamily enzyme
MAKLCEAAPFPIALDEELIGIFDKENKEALLQKVKPQYIILKPSLVGGFRGTKEWIDIAERLNIGWWITSALESNIGLNAIAQWTYLQKNPMPQGLGTGALYTNNFNSPLEVKNGELTYNPSINWNVNL